MTRNAPIRKSIIFLSIENKNVKNVVYGLKVKFVKTNNQLKSRNLFDSFLYIFSVMFYIIILRKNARKQTNKF